MDKITKEFLIKFLIEYTDVMDFLKPRYNYLVDKSAKNIIGLWLDECWSDFGEANSKRI